MNHVTRRAVLAVGAAALLGGCATTVTRKFKAEGPPQKIQSLAVVYELGRTRYRQRARAMPALEDQAFAKHIWTIARLNAIDLKVVVFADSLLKLPPLQATHLLHIRSTSATRRTSNTSGSIWFIYELESSLYEGTGQDRKLLWQVESSSMDSFGVGSALTFEEEAQVVVSGLLNELLMALHEDGFHTLPKGKMLDVDGRPFAVRARK